jgi:hypothetical protein
MQNDNRSDHDTRVTLGDTDSLRTEAHGGLAHLDDLGDFKIADGEPDIRGWDVRGADGQKLGKVEDLLVDTAALKVRYIEVKLDKDVAREMSATPASPSDAARFADRDVTSEATRDADAVSHGDDRYVLVPIGVARLDADTDDVLLDRHAAHMAGIPDYRRDESFTRDYESNVLRGYSSDASLGTAQADLLNANLPPARTAANPSDDFYTGRNFDDRSFFGSRRTGRDDESYFSRADMHDAERGGIDGRAVVDGRDVTQRDRALLESPSDLDRAVSDGTTDRTR